jgi:probable metal-binding protein
MELTQTVHAHQILDMLDQRAEPITLDTLKSEVQQAFAADAIFSNCKGDAFNFDQLIEFMLRNQKIVIADGKVRLNKAHVCNH